MEGVNISAQMRRWKTLNMPEQWTTIVRDYGELHNLSTIVLPETAEECMAMPLFGSPWILLHGEQIHLDGRWKH